MLRLLRCFRVLLVLLLVFGERGFGALRLEVPGGGGDSLVGTRFSLANARGDVTTQVDAAGNVTWQASYEAFGTRTREKGSNADAQRANSKDEDPTGLLNEGFRYRDLEAGVFISRDPAGFVDGPNVYCYVVQNPWTAWDPEGLSDAMAFSAERETLSEEAKEAYDKASNNGAAGLLSGAMKGSAKIVGGTAAIATGRGMGTVEWLNETIDTEMDNFISLPKLQTF